MCICRLFPLSTRISVPFFLSGHSSDSPPPVAAGVPAEKDSMKPTVKKTEWMDRILAEVGEKEGEKKATHNKLIPNVHADDGKERREAGERTEQDDKNAKKKEDKEASPLKHNLYTTHR